MSNTFVEGDFATQFCFKYTGFNYQCPTIPVFKYHSVDLDYTEAITLKEGSSGSKYSINAKPAYEFNRVNDKIQLTSATSPNFVILAHIRKQKIDVRDRGETVAGSNLIASIPLEWHSPRKAPKQYDLQVPYESMIAGPIQEVSSRSKQKYKTYQWWSSSPGIFDLIDKSDNNNLIARINAGPEVDVEKGDKRWLIISLTSAAYGRETGLTEEIIVCSAMGVIKRCEKNLVHFGWLDAGATAKQNGMVSFFNVLCWSIGAPC